MSRRHQKKNSRHSPQVAQGQPENEQSPAPKPFNMRRVVAMSFAIALAIVLLSYCVNRLDQAVAVAAEPMASDTGVIPDSEAQAAERAARLSASQERGMTAPADAASDVDEWDAASDAAASAL